MTHLLSVKFWKLAAERAVKTAAQVSLLVIGQDTAGFDVFDASWGTVGSFALGGAAISVLTSVASIPVGDPDGPSLV